MAEPMLSLHAPTREDNQRAALEMLFAAFAFATMSAIAHGFKGQVAWAFLSFCRIGVTWCMMLVILRLRRAPLVITGSPALWVRSISGTLGLLCIFYSLSRLPVTDTVTLLATSPVWVTILLRVIFREPAPASTWLCAVLALCGVYLMHRPTFDGDWLPLAVLMVGAVIVAVVKISLRFCRDYNPLSVVFHYASFATLFSGLVAFALTDTIVLSNDMHATTWLWLLPMGLAGTLGQVFMTHAYGRGKTTMVAVVSIVQILFAAFYDILIYGYSFDLLKIVGISLIAMAVAFSVIRSSTDGVIAAS